MGDVIQLRDYNPKIKPAPVQTPLEDGLAIIAQAMAEHNLHPEFCTGAPVGNEFGSGIDGLAWPGMDVQSPYMSPEKDPA